MAKKFDQIVTQAARKEPNKAVLVENNRLIAYSELDENITAISRSMRQMGLVAGGRVGILSRNSVEFVSNYFAVLRAGGVAVPFNWTYPSYELAAQANDCSISGLYIGGAMDSVSKGILKSNKYLRFVLKGNAFEQIKARLKAPSYGKNLASIIYTAGTTGIPRGVMLSHRNLISNNRSIVKYMKLKSADRICCVLPFYYIYGLSVLFSHIMACASVIIEDRFMYPNIVLDSIEKHQATGFAGVSSHYAMLLRYAGIKRKRISSLRYLMQAGDRMSTSLTKKILKIFPGRRLYLMYGQTEASPRLTYLDPRLVGKKPGSVGRAIPGVRIMIADEKEKPCKPYEYGEVLAKGDNIMMGYLNDRKRTLRVLRGGWLHTGDIAYKDTDGDIFLLGRKDNFVKVGGNLVNLDEVEKIAARYENIMDVVSVSVPDAVLGRKIALFVSPLPGANITKKGLICFLEERLASYKIPSFIHILKNIPKDGTGKTDRRKLEELL